MVTPSPACARALEMVASALRDDGHIVEDVSPPSPYQGLQIASQLLTADGCSVFSRPFRTGETNDPGAAQLWFYMKLPRLSKYLHTFFLRFIRRDGLWADLLSAWYPKTVEQNWALVTEREVYRGRWLDWWVESGIDILITPPHATPALPHKAMKDAVSSCGYTFLFNLVCMVPAWQDVSAHDLRSTTPPVYFRSPM